jgi:hypothetical protein
MLRCIEINHSLLYRVKEAQEGVLKNIHNECLNKDPPHEKKALQLKEYSNKFLRENHLGDARQK